MTSTNSSGFAQAFGKCISFFWSAGPTQAPASLHQVPGIGSGMTHQPAYNPLQAKAPTPPGLYPYQPVPSFNSSPSVQPLLSSPLVGRPPSHTPPLSASPSPGPRLPPGHATPPPLAAAVSSSSYYPSSQHSMAPTWQFNTAPQLPGSVAPANVPFRGTVGNHMNPPASLPAATSSAPFSSTPPPLNNPQPPRPGIPPTSMHGYTQSGKSTKTSLRARNNSYPSRSTQCFHVERLYIKSHEEICPLRF